MDTLLDLLKAVGVAGLGLLVIVGAGFSLWKAATRKATLEAAREIQEQEDEHMTHFKSQVDAIRNDDITDPDSWH